MNAECLALFKSIKYKFKHLRADIMSFENALNCNDLSIQINLLHLYGKCGYLEQCNELFLQIKDNQFETVYQREISIWNAMIHAFGRNGKLQKVQQIFEELQTETNLFPDRQTFIDLLSSFGHCDGDENVNEAKTVWTEIENLFVKYDCIVISTFVDCLARKNHLNEAYDVIIDFETKTEEIYHAMWLALLSGCRKFKKQMLGEKVYKEMSRRFKKNDHCMIHANTLL